MKYCINKGFIVQKLDDKTVIFDGEESLLYTFNETASSIFRKLKLGWNEEDIVKFIVKRYRVSQKKVEKDIIDLVSDLKKKKIISVEKSRK